VNYFYVFVLEIFVLWRLSSHLRVRLLGHLPLFLYVIFFLPGTFLHEFSHWLAAKMLFVRVGNFSLNPKQQGKGVILGSVAIEKTSITKRFIIGISPVFFGGLILFAIVYFLVAKGLTGNPLLIFLSTYVIFVLANTIFPSKKDLEGAWVVFIFCVILAITAHIFGFGVKFVSANELFKHLSLYLLIPVAIDLMVVVALFLKEEAYHF